MRHVPSARKELTGREMRKSEKRELKHWKEHRYRKGGNNNNNKKKAIIRSRKEDKGKGKKGKKLQIDVMSQRGKNKQTQQQPTKQTKIQKERKDTSM